MASSFLNPKPIAFTSISPKELSAKQMRQTIRYGKENTAMMSFSTLLDEDDIDAVIHFIREAFMAQKIENTKYHTVENGWLNHDQYASAFPFVSGEIALDVAWEDLTSEQVQGKQLYLSSCISCHDRSTVKTEGEIWRSYPLSWPRNTYSHQQQSQVDALSQASPYHIHDIKIVYEPKTPLERQGQMIFQSNCSFCHAPDGSGKHWIGQFIEPPARDFTQKSIQKIFDKQELKIKIANGVKGTAMPAWSYVLSQAEIDAVVSFMWERFK